MPAIKGCKFLNINITYFLLYQLLIVDLYIISYSVKSLSPYDISNGEHNRFYDAETFDIYDVSLHSNILIPEGNCHYTTAGDR